MPPADAQVMRHMVAANSLLFKSVLDSSAAWVPMDQLFLKHGIAFDYRSCLVALMLEFDSRPQLPWQSLPPRPEPVTEVVVSSDGAVQSNVNTLISEWLLKAYSLQQSCSSRGTPTSQSFSALEDGCPLVKLGEALQCKEQKAAKRMTGKNNAFEYSPKSILNIVRFTDNLRDADSLRPAIEQAFKIVLSDALCDHLLKQQLRTPSHATVNRHQLLVDLSCMVWARRRLFNPDELWVLHLRADSSPQFGKDYLVIMVDVVATGSITSETMFSSLVKITLSASKSSYLV